MKALFIKLASIVLCVAVVASAIIITRTEVQAASAYPTMYYNDRAWPRSGSLPMEKFYSTLYVPVTIFAQLPNVKVKKNESLNLFVIENGDYWLTFNVKTDFAYTQDSEPMYWRSAYSHGDYYVPVRSVCSYLHITFEELTSPITGETAIRISDGSQTKQFEELLRERYPGFYEEQTVNTDDLISDTEAPPSTSVPPVTSRPDTEIPAPTPGDRTIYITIENSPGEYTKDILEVLEEYDYPATFFVVGDNLLKNAKLLSQISAQGHAIGLHTMSHKSSELKTGEAILNDIEKENMLLWKLIKQKSHIWRAPDGSSKLSSLTDDVAAELSENGYEIWDFNIDAPTNARNAKSAADTVIKGIWDNETVIIRFREDKTTAEVLKLVLEFIAEYSETCDVRTISPLYSSYINIQK